MAVINKDRTIVGRNNPDFIKEMKELAKFRYLKNLENKEPSLQDMQKLLMRTNSWKSSIFELKTKPRRENL